MAQPTEKAPQLVNFNDLMSEALFGVKRTDSIKSDHCVSCKQPATEFHNAISRKEFSISGLCQTCQDKIFGVGF